MRARYYVREMSYGYEVQGVDVPVSTSAPYLFTAIREFYGAARCYVAAHGEPRGLSCSFREYLSYLWARVRGRAGAVDLT